jgi:SnoaL-like domain
MTADGDLHERLRALESRVTLLEDQVALAQLVATYGPAVDSGSAEAAAQLWREDGVFDVVPYFELAGHEGIAGMVNGEGHQSLIHNGCGHVLTAPKIVVDGDEARGWNYAFNIRWDGAADRFWIARLSANEWHFRRSAEGWRVVRRTNINLDGDEKPRALLRSAAGSGNF